MILTQLTISLSGVASRQLARSAYRLHRMIYRNFASDPRLLFRVEASGDAKLAKILIQSNAQPPEIWETHGAYFLEDPKHRILDPLTKGNRYLFRLAAAPTKMQPIKDQRGREIEIAEPEEQIAWLNRKLGSAAKIESVKIQYSRLRVVNKPGNKYAYREVMFEGVLACQDADALTTIRSQGIGRRKSVGAGLLSLVELSQH